MSDPDAISLPEALARLKTATIQAVSSLVALAEVSDVLTRRMREAESGTDEADR